jgi:hypothetical protein
VEWAKKGYLDQSAIYDIYQTAINEFQTDPHVVKMQNIHIKQWNYQLLLNFSDYFRGIFSELEIGCLPGHDSTTQSYTRYSDAIQEFVASSRPPIHTPVQLRAVVKLATEWLLFTNPDTLKDTKKIEKEVLLEEAETIRKNFSEYNDYSARPYDAPALDPDVAIRQAQELAEKMAGQKLPNLMEALQEK